jgi:hypothetical protein
MTLAEGSTMLRFWTTASVVAVLFVAAVVAEPSPEPGAKAAARWEYGELHYSYSLGRIPAGFGAGNNPAMGIPKGKGGRGRPGGPGDGAAGRGPGAGGPGAGAAGPGPGPGAAPAVARVPRTTIRWATSKATIEADGWEGMAKQLKAPPAAKDATEVNHKLRVMDRLGAQSWELVAYDRDANVWTFKRKVK